MAIYAEKNYHSHHPYLVVTKGGGVISKHYTVQAARVACTSTERHRKLLGLHRGSWVEMEEYIKGVAIRS